MGEHATLRSGVAWDSGVARAADARRVLRAFLGRVPLSGRPPVPALPALDAELVVSELVTNAIRHAPGPCGLILQLCDRELAITVWDTSTAEPTVNQGDRHRVGGHGLHLVHTVSDRVVLASRPPGKQITAHLRLTANVERDAAPPSRSAAQFPGPVTERALEGEVVSAAHGLQEHGAHARLGGEAGPAAQDRERGADAGDVRL
ncbi:ATP-binding protein [Streptomyces sp. NWU339]|uniref:ATP-binding protein n=1 Tax=Streptomyces sp. NWU339 TaxID=2185284 RepID=UPI00215AD9B3|nr:ATP-binding protein [Streptomyces sp. NWU339]